MTLSAAAASGAESMTGRSVGGMLRRGACETAEACRPWLVVVKESAWELYERRRAAGEAFGDRVRWERLRERHRAHAGCVRAVVGALREHKVPMVIARRGDATVADAERAAVVVAVGGDGTALLASQLVHGSATPVLGVNSDPSAALEGFSRMALSPSQHDDRRSTGHLCACDERGAARYLAAVLDGTAPRSERARIDTRINGSPLPPALNDVLLAHPSPAAVSRYSVVVRPPGHDRGELYYHVCSSGLRVCTATGSTAAMRSAGGELQDKGCKRMQFMDREPIYHDSATPPGGGHGFYPHGAPLRLRWNSRVGQVYMDGAHSVYNVRIGDVVEFSTAAEPLTLFDPLPPE